MPPARTNPIKSGRKTYLSAPHHSRYIAATLLVVDIWSRKVVAWDVAEVVWAQNLTDLVGRTCIKDRYRPSSFGNNQD